MSLRQKLVTLANRVGPGKVNQNAMIVETEYGYYVGGIYVDNKLLQNKEEPECSETQK